MFGRVSDLQSHSSLFGFLLHRLNSADGEFWQHRVTWIYFFKLVFTLHTSWFFITFWGILPVLDLGKVLHQLLNQGGHAVSSSQRAGL